MSRRLVFLITSILMHSLAILTSYLISAVVQIFYNANDYCKHESSVSENEYLYTTTTNYCCVFVDFVCGVCVCDFANLPAFARTYVLEIVSRIE